MTQERMAKFLAYVNRVNKSYHGDVHAGFTSEYKDESLKIWFNDKIHGKPDNRFFCYHTSAWYGDGINKNVYTRHDPNLVRAEKHILKVIREADKGYSDERQAISG